MWIVFKEEASFWDIIAAVPERVELGCEVIEVEGDPVRLMGKRCTFHHPWILCGALHQREFLVVEKRKIGIA